MIWNPGSIFTTPPRRAESADARLDIRRHDPDQERKKKDERQSEPKFTFDTYDNANVSVDALQMFLENFLKSLTPAENSAIVADVQAEIFAPTPDKQTASAASHAASAYQTGAKTAPHSSVTESASAAEEAKALLGNEDVRVIYTLLADIKILQQREIAYLTLEQGETFLAALVAAVEKAKGQASV